MHRPSKLYHQPMLFLELSRAKFDGMTTIRDQGQLQFTYIVIHLIIEDTVLEVDLYAEVGDGLRILIPSLMERIYRWPPDFLLPFVHWEEAVIPMQPEDSQ